MIKLKCLATHYGYNQNGSLNKRIGVGSVWIYLGVDMEIEKHKLERVYEKENAKRKTFAYVSKEDIKRNFGVIKND